MSEYTLTKGAPMPAAGVRPEPRRSGEGFWCRVDRSAGPDACWPWQGRRTKWGHGTLKWQGVQRTASAVAFEIENGAVPEGMIVTHRCDNPPCCNPAHLRAGTHETNAEDRSAAGSLHGERNGRSKLTQEQVNDIRSRYVARDKQNGMTALAEQHGVTKRTIWLVLTGQTWGR